MRTRRPVVIANSIRMKRSQYVGSFLIVEGSDDRLFMEAYTSTAYCRIVVAEGKGNVLEVIDILERDSFSGVLGLVDADFDRIENTAVDSVNIVTYETHDLEAMLVSSRALNGVLYEFGSNGKLQLFETSVLEALVARAMLVACLRLHSLRSDLGLRFQGMNYTNWIDRTEFTSNVGDLITEVKNRSQRQDLSTEQLESDMQSIGDDGLPPLEMCNGTDLIEILAIGLQRKLGSNPPGRVNAEVLRRSLRLAYSDEMFKSSHLIRDIQGWQVRVGSFRILRSALC